MFSLRRVEQQQNNIKAQNSGENLFTDDRNICRRRLPSHSLVHPHSGVMLMELQCEQHSHHSPSRRQTSLQKGTNARSYSIPTNEASIAPKQKVGYQEFRCWKNCTQHQQNNGNGEREKKQRMAKQTKKYEGSLTPRVQEFSSC